MLVADWFWPFSLQIIHVIYAAQSKAEGGANGGIDLQLNPAEKGQMGPEYIKVLLCRTIHDTPAGCLSHHHWAQVSRRQYRVLKVAGRIDWQQGIGVISYRQLGHQTGCGNA